ncbi:MAG: hypothetical protein ACXV76_13525 [Halobacteriota archaeon]
MLSLESDEKEGVTAGRALLVGVYAFGWKKKTPYLVLTFNDVIGVQQNPAFDPYCDISGDISVVQPHFYAFAAPRCSSRAKAPF